MNSHDWETQLLLLLLSRFSRVWLCATPQMAAHQAPLSLGFSRQEHWSGLPFPSPMHACMLSRFICVWLCATLWTAAHQVPLSTGFSRQKYWSGLPFPSPEKHRGGHKWRWWVRERWRKELEGSCGWARPCGMGEHCSGCCTHRISFKRSCCSLCIPEDTNIE